MANNGDYRGWTLAQLQAELTTLDAILADITGTGQGYSAFGRSRTNVNYDSIQSDRRAVQAAINLLTGNLPTDRTFADLSNPNE